MLQVKHCLGVADLKYKSSQSVLGVLSLLPFLTTIRIRPFLFEGVNNIHALMLIVSICWHFYLSGVKQPLFFR